MKTQKFEITIKEQHLEQLRECFNNDDADIADDDDIGVIKECFFVEDRRGELADLRDKIKIKELK